ncbi:FCD domain-containing protein [Vibrio sp. SS-MA-C1-2]|uniref:GntR family transcriptional regulator n=1 Tax=Vibrio sp. SS-MA-C1-2 TaxID=2908646 RepID=UPI001F365424|nr:FCD domain-containing protein [Vibrio sp. SS-MA-C1-2]UJF17899.1 FCD domain-containing protein [Vibrio sp. SS-MA-C1-2]
MKQTKSTLVYREIKNNLMKGQYLPGEKLKISDLKAEYNFSLAPLREALSQLAAQGLLNQEINKGYSIPHLSLDDILNIKNGRVLIESEALKLSLKNGDIDWEAKLISAHHKLEKYSLAPETLEEWSYAHEAFHSILLSGSTNHYLINFSTQLNLALNKYRSINGSDVLIRKTLDKQHYELLQCALNRDIDKATKILVEHIELSCQSAINSLQEASESVSI